MTIPIMAGYHLNLAKNCSPTEQFPQHISPLLPFYNAQWWGYESLCTCILYVTDTGWLYLGWCCPDDSVTMSTYCCTISATLEVCTFLCRPFKEAIVWIPLSLHLSQNFNIGIGFLLTSKPRDQGLT